MPPEMSREVANQNTDYRRRKYVIKSAGSSGERRFLRNGRERIELVSVLEKGGREVQLLGLEEKM